MNLTEAHRKLAGARNERKRLTEQHTRDMRQIGREETEAKNAIALAASSLDTDKIALGQNILVVSGDWTRAGCDRKAAMDKAVEDLALNGAAVLRTRYFGTKNYDRWNGQLVCVEYGMAPRHGHVVFRIGMAESARKRPLTPEETEAALYLLAHLETVQRIDRQNHVADLNMLEEGQ